MLYWTVLHYTKCIKTSSHIQKNAMQCCSSALLPIALQLIRIRRKWHRPAPMKVWNVRVERWKNWTVLRCFKISRYFILIDNLSFWDPRHPLQWWVLPSRISIEFSADTFKQQLRALCFVFLFAFCLCKREKKKCKMKCKTRKGFPITKTRWNSWPEICCTSTSLAFAGSTSRAEPNSAS